MDTPQEKPSEHTTPAVCTAGIPPIDSQDAPTPSVCTAGIEPAIPFYKKHLTLIISALVGLGIVLGAGYYAYTTYYVKGGIVATVNSKHIYQTELSESMSFIEQGAVAQGVDVADESIKTEIRTQALDVLISNALLLTAAEKAGIEISDADIQTKYDELVKEFGSQEELSKRMTEMGLTEEKLRSNIKERILADKYIESATDITSLTITDDEILEFVKSHIQSGQKAPTVEEARPQVEPQLLAQKQQKVVTDLIAKLRAEADIDVRTE